MALGGIGGAVRDIILRVKVMSKNATSRMRSARQKVLRFTNGVVQNGRKMAKSGINKTMNGLGSSADNAAQGTNVLNSSLGRFLFVGNKVDKQTGQVTKSVSGFRMEFLSVMFAGMALMRVFTRLRETMFGLEGATSALSTSFGMALMPLANTLRPLMLSISEALMNASKPTKVFLSIITALLGVLGFLAMIFGQVMLLSMGMAKIWPKLITLSNMLGTAWSKLTSVFSTVISKIGPKLISFFNTMAGIATSFVAGFTAGFLAVIKVANTFGKKIAAIVGTILAVVGAVIAAIASAPAIIAAAIGVAGGALVGLVVTFWDEIVNYSKRAGGWLKQTTIGIIDTIKSAFSSAASSIKNTLSKIGSSIKNTFKSAIDSVKNLDVKQAGKNMVDGIVDGIKAAPDKLINAIKEIVPDWLITAAKKAGGAVSSGVGAIRGAVTTGLQDFILTSDGKLMEFSPKDNIMGFQNTPPTGGGASQVNININNPELRDNVDINALVDKIERRIDRDVSGRSIL